MTQHTQVPSIAALVDELERALESDSTAARPIAAILADLRRMASRPAAGAPRTFQQVMKLRIGADDSKGFQRIKADARVDDVFNHAHCALSCVADVLSDAVANDQPIGISHAWILSETLYPVISALSLAHSALIGAFPNDRAVSSQRVAA